MPALPLSFERGIDRSRGAFVSDPASLARSENVVVRDGRVLPRGGIEQRCDLGGTYTAGGHAERVEKASVLVRGEGTPGAGSHKLVVYRGLGNGTAPVLIDDWLDPCDSTEKARVIAAQAGRKVFLAHDEPTLSRRGQTVYFDVDTDALVGLSAAWADDGVGDQDLRFRGVVSHLDYLLGWGFGTNVAGSPQNYVRISDQGIPQTFSEDSWQSFGHEADPVLVVVPLGTEQSSLSAVLKETEMHVLVGSDANTFGGYQVDWKRGVAHPRLALEHQGVLYSWTLDGPARSQGGPLEMMDLPLGLRYPDAYDIAAMGALPRGCCGYDPDRRCVIFAFDDYGYVWDTVREEWTNDLYGSAIHCFFTLYPNTGWQGASRGHPEFAAPTAIGGSGFTARWTNVLAEGDETVEIWLKAPGGAWPGAATVSVALSAGTTYAFDPKVPGTYGIAYRYLREGVYSTGYTVADPDTWPATARGTYAHVATAPTLAVPVWSRTGASAEQVALATTSSNALLETRFFRNTVDTFGTAAALTPDQAAGASAALNDTTISGETVYYYWAAHINPDASVAAQSASRRVWSGPAAIPTMVSLEQNVPLAAYIAEWTNGDAALETELHEQENGGAFSLETTEAAAETTYNGLAKNYGSTYGVKARHKATTFTVDDFGEFSNTLEVEVVDDL